MKQDELTLRLLIKKVGGPVAKLIVQFWLGVDPASKVISSTIVDVIDQWFENPLTSRELTRQFSEIEEHVAQSVFPMFKAHKIDDGERQAVLDATHTTLSETRPSADLALLHGLDHELLYKDLRRRAGDHDRDFSADGVALFDRLLRESARATVSVALDLPEVKKSLAVEQIKLDRSIARTSERVLEELARVRKAVDELSTSFDFGSFERDYRYIVARTLNRMNVFGIDLSESALRQLPLDAAYVSLSLSENRPDPPTDEIEDARPVGSVPVEFAVAQNKRFLLLGPAGSGKTTLVKWLATTCAGRAFDATVGQLNDLVPFVVTLRELVGKKLPAPDELPGMLWPASQNPTGWAHEVLTNGRGIILIDGYDEVPARQRGMIDRWIESLCLTFVESRVVVTARGYAVSDLWLSGLGFQRAHIEPMTNRQLFLFVSRWYWALRRSFEEIEKAVDDSILASREEDVKRQIAVTPSLRSLATSPLLCSAICAIHFDRNQALPKDRIELYEACCYMLIERYGLERGIPSEETDYPQLSYRAKKAILQEIAYWMISIGHSQVPRERMLTKISGLLPNMNLPGETTPQEIYRLLVDRTGMLREPSVETVDFRHRSFQEYLGAIAAIARDEIEVLARMAREGMWNEAIVVAAGLAGPRTDDLVTSILELHQEVGEPRLCFLAASCAQVAVHLRHDIRMKVASTLASHVPPSSRGEAEEFAKCGEMAAPYLIDNQEYSHTQRDACIACLVKIGGRAAQQTVYSFTKNMAPSIRTLLAEAYSEFCNDEYVRTVLSSLQLRNLVIEGAQNVDGIKRLEKLSELVIQNCALPDISGIIGMSNLSRLEISEVYELEDLSPIGTLVGLEFLLVEDVPRVKRVSFSKELSRLRRMKLVAMPSLTELTGLNRLRALREIELVDTGLRSFDVLRPLESIRSATIEAAESLPIDSLEFVKGLASLRHLRISSHECPTLEPLLDCPSPELQSLHIDCDVFVDSDGLIQRAISRFRRHSISF